MTSRTETPSNAMYGSVPAPGQSYTDQGYGFSESSTARPNGAYGGGHNATTGIADFATGTPSAQMSSRLVAASNDPPGSVIVKDHSNPMPMPPAAAADSGLMRSTSSASTAYNRDSATPSRSGTLKKKASVSRTRSLRRSNSRKSMTAGSIKGVGFAGDGATSDGEDYNSALYTPIPTSGSPTEILADRFQAWRTLLKSLITYFREVQSSYDHRSKALMKVSNVIQNMQTPSAFMTTGGLADATRVLADYHRHAVTESTKSKDIETDVIQALSGLRSDLSQKIKEIKSLHGDFKNTVEKEKDGTKKAISAFAEALHDADHSDASKADPFLVKLGVDRSIERQIDEENYLHRAYLNLETSGRELEAIVVGEIQKAYNAIAGILKREGDDAYNAVEQLRTGPIAMPKDMEWLKFVENDPRFVNPRLPLRSIEDITYPGKGSPQAAEIRAGMLERKSKYLKSYTPGWYVLSPTHLHEFKSADKIYSQPPVMSLYLPDQRLGSHSTPDSASHKFMLKGRQSGSMHRGHSWVFRAESYDTMLAWYEAIKILTEKSPEERNAFVREHARSLSGGNNIRPSSISSDGLEEDEADRVPYSAASSVVNQPVGETKPVRPLPGGRFPSDLNVNHERDASSPSSESEPDRDTIAAAGVLPGGGLPFPGSNLQNQDRQLYETDPYRLEGIATNVTATPTPAQQQFESNPESRFNAQPVQNSAYPTFGAPQQQPIQTQTYTMPVTEQPPLAQAQRQPELGSLDGQHHVPYRQNTNYGEWLAPVAAGAGAGTLGAVAYNHHEQNKEQQPYEQQQQQQPLAQQPLAQDNDRALYHEPVSTTPIVTAVNAGPTTTMPAATAGAYTTNSGVSGVTNDVSSSPSSPQVYSSSDAQLGGLERDGAHGTGNIFPAVIRHDTDMSVSQLHIPGEFPAKRTTASAAPSRWDLVRE